MGGDRQATPAGPAARGRGGLTPVRGRRSRPAGPVPGARSPAPGPSAAAGPAAGRGHGRRRRHPPGSTSSVGGGSSSRAGSPWHHLPPPPRPRRRLPTAHPAPPTDTIAGVPVPAAAPNSGRAGGREGSGRSRERSAGPSALRRGPGGSGPRPVRAEGPRRRAGSEAAPGFAGRRADAAGAGFVIVDSVPSSAGHAGRRRAGEGRAGGAEGRRAGPEVAGSRRPAGGKGAESAGGRCPLLTWEAGLGGPGAAAAGRRAFPQGELDLPLPRRAGLSEADPAEGWIGSRGKGSSLQRIAEERGLPRVGVWSPAPWAARWGARRAVGRRGQGLAAIPTPGTSQGPGLPAAGQCLRVGTAPSSQTSSSLSTELHQQGESISEGNPDGEEEHSQAMP